MGINVKVAAGVETPKYARCDVAHLSTKVDLNSMSDLLLLMQISAMRAHMGDTSHTALSTHIKCVHANVHMQRLAQVHHHR